MAKSRKEWMGWWRITKMSEWDKKYCDMETEAFISIGKGGQGEFQFGLVCASFFGEFIKRGEETIFDFTFEGSDEMDSTFGDGWMILKKGKNAEGKLRFHDGDSSLFWAKKQGGRSKMEMVPFYEDFGEIAEKETRCMILPAGKQGVPAGRYAMVESYCNDKKCDCRRVFINVLHEETNQILATIGFGWEDVKFYQGWAGNKETGIYAKGPVLELGGFQSKYAQIFLELFKKIFPNDTVFIERLKRHYKMVKSK